MVDTPQIQERETIITLEDLIQRMARDDRVEVVDGQFREFDIMTASYTHVEVIDTIYELVRPFVRRKRPGLFRTDGITFVLHIFEKGIRVTRIPDLCFIRRSRIPKDFDPDKPFMGAPDLAIEVVSPHQDIEELQARISDYLRYGTEQVWVVYPRVKSVHVYDSRDTHIIRIFNAADTLQAETFFPGLTINVADFFVSELAELDNDAE